MDMSKKMSFDDQIKNQLNSYACPVERAKVDTILDSKETRQVWFSRVAHPSCPGHDPARARERGDGGEGEGGARGGGVNAFKVCAS